MGHAVAVLGNGHNGGMYGRPPRKPPPPEPRVPAAAVIMAGAHEDRPFGLAGETVLHRPERY
jgi:hypothetical protein